MKITMDTENVFEKSLHPFRIKHLKNLGKQKIYLNIIKAIYMKYTICIILNVEKLKTFPPKFD